MLLSTLATAGAVSATCNPLDSTCDPVPALGGSLNTDFTTGASSRYDPTLAVNKISYGDNGVDFEISASGDNPSIDSDFYIMFGHIEFVAQAAPGVGIVSSMVLISDDNDEIDIEWLGGDGTQVQSNYFSKGDTSTYDRGAFHEIASPQTNFYTYAIDWTSERTIWYVNGAPVRTLTNPGTGYYPQSPMKVRFGSWAGGDSSNAPGTIEWAGGATDYSAGPFHFYVKSLNVQDYSTGTAYKFTDQSGSWTAVEAVDGAVNGNLDGSAPAQSQSISSESASPSTSTSSVSSSETPASSTEPATSTEVVTSTVPSTSEAASSTEPATSTLFVSSTESSSSEAASSSGPATSTLFVSSTESSSSEPASTTEPATSTLIVSSTESSSSEAASSTEPATSTEVVTSTVPSTSEAASSTEPATSTLFVSSTESSSSEAASSSEPATSTEIVSSTESSSVEPSSTVEVSSSATPSSSVVSPTSTVGIPSSTVSVPVITTSTVEPSVNTPSTVAVIPSSSVSNGISSVIVEKTSTSTVVAHPTTSKAASSQAATATLSTVYNSSISQVTQTGSIPQVNGASHYTGASFMAFAGFVLASLLVI